MGLSVLNHNLTSSKSWSLRTVAVSHCHWPRILILLSEKVRTEEILSVNTFQFFLSALRSVNFTLAFGWMQTSDYLLRIRRSHRSVIETHG